MEPIALAPVITCSQCHLPLPPNAYFCPNCGAEIKKPPPSTSLPAQISLYLKSLILFPLGFVWGGRYLFQPGIKSKIIGLITITLTFIELVLIIVTTVRLINNVNEQIAKQLPTFGTF